MLVDPPDRFHPRRGYLVPLQRDQNLGKKMTTTMPIMITLLD